MIMRLFAVFLLFELLLSSLVFGKDLRLEVSDQHGKPLAGAVVEILADAVAKPGDRSSYVMDQINKAFVPKVLVVPQGADVEFPNSDNIRHQVYSFSRAKTFELKLYAGRPKRPVQFGTHGVVVLGCNIHDSMVGYIYVAESPYTAVTGDDGIAVFKRIPTDIHKITVWHPDLANPEQPVPLAVNVAGGGSFPVTLTTVKPAPRNTFDDVFRNAE